jgi:DtxR family Mn-dependent transcriptional regulator
LEATRAVQDYLKAIYALQTRGEAVVNARLAERLGISPPSVSAMMRRLETGALVRRLPSGALVLTELGEAQALRTVRRHRLIETFLYRCLAVPWDEVHDEAEVLEHAVSARLEDRIAATLGHPSHDPHGDPIPPRDGVHEEGWPGPLGSMPEGAWVVVERVSDRNADVLRHLADLGIVPGTVLEVEQRVPFGGPLWVRVADARHALGDVLVGSIFGSVQVEGLESPRIEDAIAEVEDRRASEADSAAARRVGSRPLAGVRP